MSRFNAENLIGKVILVWLIYYDNKNKLVNRTENWGRIVEADDYHTVIEQKNGKKFGLPPCLNHLQFAAHATYNLHSTCESIVNPDYLAMWHIMNSDDK